jgi:hypothetical protein
MDWAAFPPQFNSGRMYAGAGSGPMLAAAAAWDTAELHAAAGSYQSVVSGLIAGQWLGASSMSMAAAAAAFAAWMHATAAQVEQTGAQAKMAAAAYEAAFAETVPPQVIAANRTQLATLVATNIFGQNTPAIAATEAEYAEMWAQDPRRCTATRCRRHPPPRCRRSPIHRGRQTRKVRPTKPPPSGKARARLPGTCRAPSRRSHKRSPRYLTR